jgi:hypothetical protein
MRDRARGSRERADGTEDNGVIVIDLSAEDGPIMPDDRHPPRSRPRMIIANCPMLQGQALIVTLVMLVRLHAHVPSPFTPNFSTLNCNALAVLFPAPGRGS